MGNAGVLLRAYIYMRMLGREGMQRVGEYATLERELPAEAAAGRPGFDAAYPQRRASHEFIVTLKRQARELDVTAMDFAKRLLDYGFHAPTTYFPLLVPECLLIEPTETESKEVLDAFVDGHVTDPARSRARTRARDAAHRIPCRCAASTTCGRPDNWISHGSRWRSRRSLQAPRGHAPGAGASAQASRGLNGALREEAAFRQELAFVRDRHTAGPVARARGP